MTTDRLKEHYEWRYSAERHIRSIQSIADTDCPTDRYQAAVHYLPRLFKGTSVLEVGAGTGHIAKSLLERDLGISRYVLSDISGPRLEGIRASLADSRVSVVEMDADEPPADLAGQFDAIILVALIEHLVDPMGAMKKLRSLLRPGGFVYVDTPNIARYTQRLKLLAGRFPSTGSTNEGLTTHDGKDADLYDEGHLHYFTFRSLSLMLTRYCGYRRVERLPYAGGRNPLGAATHFRLARLWPEMFSELLVAAYAD
ncbi:MAG: class I SAM-dependent methyltransferase [Lautropia sp.]